MKKEEQKPELVLSQEVAALATKLHSDPNLELTDYEALRIALQVEENKIAESMRMALYTQGLSNMLGPKMGELFFSGLKPKKPSKTK